MLLIFDGHGILARVNQENEELSMSNRILIASISGIRGVFGAGLGPAELVSYASAYAAWCLEQPGDRRLVVVGRDARTTGDICSRIVCGTLAAAGLVITPPRPPGRLLRASPLEVLPSAGEVAYFGVGRTATVLLLEIGGRWQLRANGLPEAVIQRRGGRPTPHRAAAWLGVMPAMARPDARSMLLIGLGGGVALEGVPATLEQIDVVELEPEVVAAGEAGLDYAAHQVRGGGLHPDEGRGWPSHAVFQGLSSAVLLPYHGRDGCGGAAGRHRDGDAG